MSSASKSRLKQDLSGAVEDLSDAVETFTQQIGDICADWEQRLSNGTTAASSSITDVKDNILLNDPNLGRLLEQLGMSGGKRKKRRRGGDNPQRSHSVG